MDEKMSDFLFLDSGLGALPYVMHLKKKAPFAECVYYADNLHFPYGEKSKEEIRECAALAAENAIARFHPAVVVIACNTITVNSLSYLRELFPATPFVGTVPAVKVAANVSKTGCIALLASRATTESEYTADLVRRFAAGYRVISCAAPSLIEFVEKRLFTATFEEKVEFCRAALSPLLKEGCDTLVLGCTHFLNIREEIKEAWGGFVVDSLEGVTKQALSLHAPSSENPSKTKLFSSAATEDENYRLLSRKFDLVLV